MTQKTIAIAATAGNANGDSAVAANKAQVLKAVHFKITTSADVANRFPRVSILDASDAVVAVFRAGTAITAGLADQVVQFADGLVHTAVVDGIQNAPVAGGLVLGPGWKVRLSVTGGVAADSYTATIVVDEE